MVRVQPPPPSFSRRYEAIQPWLSAIQVELKRRGLDEESKQHYVELLWKYAESEAPENEKRQLTFLRLLGKALLPEQVQLDSPQTLPLRNLDEGLKRMGLVPANAGDLGDEDESANFDA